VTDRRKGKGLWTHRTMASLWFTNTTLCYATIEYQMLLAIKTSSLKTEQSLPCEKVCVLTLHP
jgi:hypothetical protein